MYCVAAHMAFQVPGLGPGGLSTQALGGQGLSCSTPKRDTPPGQVRPPPRAISSTKGWVAQGCAAGSGPTFHLPNWLYRQRSDRAQTRASF